MPHELCPSWKESGLPRVLPPSQATVPTHTGLPMCFTLSFLILYCVVIDSSDKQTGLTVTLQMQRAVAPRDHLTVEAAQSTLPTPAQRQPCWFPIGHQLSVSEVFPQPPSSCGQPFPTPPCCKQEAVYSQFRDEQIGAET